MALDRVRGKSMLWKLRDGAARFEHSVRQGMATKLYDMAVPTFLQTARAVGGFLEKAADHCGATGIDPNDLVTARLYPDMAPFWFQIECVDNYSVYGIEAMRTGTWQPPGLVQVVPFADLQARIAQSISALEAFEPDEVNAWSGKALDIAITHVGPDPTSFTSETFFLSFLLPNFHFHAVTAYDILRTYGTPIGKRDYEGQLRTHLSVQHVGIVQTNLPNRRST
ncbi:hypothetical protein SAMN04488020_11924 [Palleronia marisminoris]|uniref:Uncharacterized protein n=1 Tax=Palleronia marisminoris TaxID=315423 RepID=A0A1Y5TS56_9RHOB|nr:DUF1993 domain-containing protein [Palleronia marisminoris]SFH51465.1 hypothetical protein SAMN04488020_11924 [Palleronia marisminoris]SLN70930.1 hypothetical protein PAM7066_03614 [Palleronia marisminoris]